MKKQLPFFLAFFIAATTSLCYGQKPVLWGMTTGGGAGGSGTIFNYDLNNNLETKVYDFGLGNDGSAPYGPLTQVNDSLFYGMTLAGGSDNSGIIFSYNSNTGKETIQCNLGVKFTDGGRPYGSLLQVNDSLLFGMTSQGGNDSDIAGDGVIFDFNILNGKKTVLHVFGNGTDGSFPDGSLIQLNNGLLYGIASEGGKYSEGMLFNYDISTNTETDIYDFGNGKDGGYPYGTLTEVNDSLFYGVTTIGGKYDSGTIFKYNILNNNETILYNFHSTPYGYYYSPNGFLTLMNDSLLCGLTVNGGPDSVGTLFSFNTRSAKFTTLHNFGVSSADGRYPFSPLVQAKNGLLYGMTQLGGTYKYGGTIFTFDISTNSETVIYNFGSAGDGMEPDASLMLAKNGLLYGMTSFGGINYGAIFSFNTSTNSESELYEFDGDLKGMYPKSILLRANNKLLYGLSTYGGTNRCGFVFTCNPNTDSVNVVYNIRRYPNGEITFNSSLMQASNGLLYGVISGLSSGSNSRIFNFNPRTNIETSLDSIGGNEILSGAFIQATDSLLYASIGDVYGSIVSYNIKKDTVSKLFIYPASGGGAVPYSSLIQANNGLLYGITAYGGTNGLGNIFSYNISTGVESDLYDFGSGKDGWNSREALIQASNGLLYGVTENGGMYGYGTIFSYDISKGKETVLHNFMGGADGFTPTSTLLQVTDSMLYGFTQGGGTYQGGTIFSYNILTGIKTNIHDFGNGADGAFPEGGALIEIDTLVNANTPVWPGDANEDLTANNYDLLPIGLYYGYSGNSRDSVSNDWKPQACVNWDSTQSNGLNRKFVDCNGDGIINSDDTLAITLNYGLSHSYDSPNGYTDNASETIPFSIITDSAIYHSGSPVHANILLGSSTNPASNIYGLAYNIAIYPSSIKPGSLSFNYTNKSLLGTKNSNALTLTHLSNDVETAVVGTDHINKNGYGKIGDLYFRLADNLTAPIILSFSNYEAVDSKGNHLILSLMNDTLNITTGINQVLPGNSQFSIFPNPTSGQFTIKSNGNQNGYTIEVYNVLGEKVYQSIPTKSQEVINLTSQPDGMYFVYLKSDDGVEVGKVLLTK